MTERGEGKGGGGGERGRGREGDTYLLKALVSLTFLLWRTEDSVGLSGGEVLELIFWLKLSVLLTGFGKVGTITGVALLGPVGVFNFDVNEVRGIYLGGGQLAIFDILGRILGLGATGGGIFVGGGIARLSSLNGSG